MLEEDILPVKNHLESDRNLEFSFVTVILIVLLFAFPPFVFVLLLFISARRKKLVSEKDIIRASRAYKKFKTALKKIDADDKDMFPVDISRVINVYLSERFLLEGGIVTQLDVDEKLSGHLKDGTRPELKILLDEIDSLRYGAGKGGQELLSMSRELISKIERER